MLEDLEAMNSGSLESFAGVKTSLRDEFGYTYVARLMEYAVLIECLMQQCYKFVARYIHSALTPAWASIASSLF
jgi:hypothetical protein